MLEELQRRNYSPATIRSYLRCVAEVAQHFHRSPDQLGANDIRQFQLFLIKQRRLAWSTYNVFVSALRFFYVKTLKQPFILEDIPFQRAPQQLPEMGLSGIPGSGLYPSPGYEHPQAARRDSVGFLFWARAPSSVLCVRSWSRLMPSLAMSGRRWTKKT